MLIPVAHEDLKGRRWPYVTIAIIALNFVVFLFTHSRIDDDSHKMGEVRLHILLLETARPDVQTTPEAQRLVQSFQHDNPQLYDRMRERDRPPIDLWDIQMRDWTPEQANREMASLSQQLDQLEHQSVLGRYAFYPSAPNPWSFLTALFLHAGWLHLIFNMWFFWLAGTVLEDAWGRIVYPIVYFVSGVASLFAHAAFFPHSLVPVIGASGAIAGLIGAFLVRFPKTRIQMMFVLWLGFRPYVHRFFVRAYVLLPIWLLLQVFWALLAGKASGVAYWAHVGGFIFGIGAALLLRFTGIEHAMDAAIEQKVSWTADPRIVKAGELIAQNQPDAAIAELKQLLQQKPDWAEAYELLLRAHEKKQDFQAQKEDVATLCRLYTQSGEMKLAEAAYNQFVNLGGEHLPKDVWMELCRHMEDEQNWQRAAEEYERLAKAFPTHRVSVQALLAAAKIHLKKLNHSAEAARLYRETDSSSVPHLDSEAVIQAGLKDAEEMLRQKEGVPAG